MKLFTVIGALLASSAMENVPFVVATEAAYVFVGSMHVGGGLANVVVRAALPSLGGHGVSPVIDAPAPGMVMATGVGAALAVELEAAVTGVVAPPHRQARQTIAATV